jgi:hypothetical protein
VERVDYLRLNVDEFKWRFSKIHIIGNPPFGRQSSLAIQFIKKSCGFCDTISFILPKSFKKESMKRAFSSTFHLIFEEDLPKKAFLLKEKEYDVPCVFQIWEKREVERDVVEKVAPRGFQFVKKNDGPNISFRRVGGTAGTVDTNYLEKSEQSHYFIRFTNGKSVEENVVAVNRIVYEMDNTVGPKSISKPEIVVRWNAVL